MEGIYTILQELQLDIFQVIITGLILFATGFWLGHQKNKKLLRQMHKMEKEIMDLNSELLYNTHGLPLEGVS